MFVKIKEYCEDKIVLVGLVFLLLLALILSWGFFCCEKDEEDSLGEIPQLALKEENIDEEENVADKKIFVDIKGAVKKPGVYEITEGMIVNDVITLAEGLTSSAYTNNINLSKKIQDEMVIYIYTKSEFKNLTKEKEVVEKVIEKIIVNESCDITESIQSGETIIENNSENSQNSNVSEENKVVEESKDSTLVNINTASVTELQTLSGIGLSKAEAIIKYRNTNGLFKTIEELKNVSGIGDSTFENIKNYITI